MDVVKIPEEEVYARIEKLQRALEEHGFEGALILHNPNLFYYAGTVQDAYLWMPAAGEPTLVVRKHIERARSDSPLKQFIPIKSPKQLPDVFKGLIPSGKPKVGMEFDVVPVSAMRQWRDMFPSVIWENVSGPIWRQRTVKSPLEIDSIRVAGRMVTSTFMEVPSLFKPGMGEQELSSLMVQRMRMKGHHGYIRTRNWRSEIYVGGTVSSGPSADAPWPFDGPVAQYSRYTGITSLNSPRIIEKDQPVLIDMVGGYNGYYYDFSRTFVRGKLDGKLAGAYEAAVRIRDEVVKGMKPGARPKDLYELALDLAGEAGISEAFMNRGGNKVRFIGHGIGLELDEAPVIARAFEEPLVEGNVVALEPKAVFPVVGGVGVEDTILVTDGGGEILCPCESEIISFPN